MNKMRKIFELFPQLILIYINILRLSFGFGHSNAVKLRKQRSSKATTRSREAVKLRLEAGMQVTDGGATGNTERAKGKAIDYLKQ